MIIMAKFDILLRQKLGADPPGDIHKVIIEYYVAPTELDVRATQQTGVRITGISKVASLIYAEGTKESLLALENDPNIKRIYLSETVGAMYHE